MAILFRVILLFLIIFNFRVPVVYNSTVLSVILSLSYYCFIQKKIPLYYFKQRYQAIILGGSILMIFASALVAILHATYEFTLVKAATLQLFMLFGLVLSLPIMFEDEGSNGFEDVSLIVCYAFVLQGMIQLSGFLIPPWGDFLISMKTDSVRDMLLNSPYNIYFRGYALAGQPFFELPAGFGVAFILFFRLLLTENQKLLTRYKPYVMFFFLFIGSMFSGRTAFVGLALGLFLVLVLRKNLLGLTLKLVRRMIIPLILTFLIYQFVLPPKYRNKLDNDIFPFAFEFYYKYEATGKFTTSSTDVMVEKHYFAIPTETFLFGDGWFNDALGGYYMKTDAGYMRNILFGGIPYFLILVIYQSLYFIQPWKLSRKGKTYKDHIDFLTFLLLFLHIFILNYKGTALGTQNIMQVLLLFIGSGYMLQYNDQKAENGTAKI